MIQLEDGVKYTFRFTDEFHPDGVVISNYAQAYENGIHCNVEVPGIGDISVFQYYIGYFPSDNTTRSSATYPDPDDPFSICYFATSIDQCTDIHKIPKRYLESELPELNPSIEIGQFVSVDGDPNGMKYVLVPNPAEYGTIQWNDGSPTGDSNYNLLRLMLADNSLVYLSRRYSEISGGTLPTIKNHLQFTRVITTSTEITGIELYDIEIRLGGAMTGTLYTKTFS